MYQNDNEEYTISRKQLALTTVVAMTLVVRQIVIVAVSIAATKSDSVGIAYIHEYIPNDTVVMGKPSLYHQLLDYPNFISYDSGERYGIILRGEDYDTYYEREQAEVFVGMPNLDDENIWRYMNAHNFQLVIGDVWVSEALLTELISEESPPDIIFSTSEVEIPFGSCVILEWTVENADKVFLNQEIVDSNEMREVCLLTTTNFMITALWQGGIVSEELDIVVE